MIRIHSFASTEGKLGLTTCYDVRFPEMYAPLVQKGAQILLVPSAFTVPTGAAHWHTLLKGEITTRFYASLLWEGEMISILTY